MSLILEECVLEGFANCVRVHLIQQQEESIFGELKISINGRLNSSFRITSARNLNELRIPLHLYRSSTIQAILVDEEDVITSNKLEITPVYSKADASSSSFPGITSSAMMVILLFLILVICMVPTIGVLSSLLLLLVGNMGMFILFPMYFTTDY